MRALHVLWPGINNFDLALMRKVPIRERLSLQFRGEFYNAFQSSQLHEPEHDHRQHQFR